MKSGAALLVFVFAACRSASPVPSDPQSFAPAAAAKGSPGPVPAGSPFAPMMRGTAGLPPREAARIDAQRQDLLSALKAEGGDFSSLLRDDGLEGPLVAGRAVEAYAEGRGLAAVLLARAALGADPGNPARRALLRILESRTGVPADPGGILPLAALARRETRIAENAFFAERYGAALQAARRVVLLTPEDSGAWARLGSSFYSLGMREQARSAYARALERNPNDAVLRRFFKERGWDLRVPRRAPASARTALPIRKEVTSEIASVRPPSSSFQSGTLTRDRPPEAGTTPELEPETEPETAEAPADSPPRPARRGPLRTSFASE